jgi:hypothetical protein
MGVPEPQGTDVSLYKISGGVGTELAVGRISRLEITGGVLGVERVVDDTSTEVEEDAAVESGGGAAGYRTANPLVEGVGSKAGRFNAGAGG